MMKSKKHIVLITPGFPLNEMDTRCIPALQIYCNALNKKEGIKLSVITLHYPFTTKPYEWNHIDVYPLGFQNRLSIPYFSNKKVTRMIRIIYQNDPIDLIHSFWLGECSLAGHRFSKRNSIDHITTLMGQDAKKGNRYAKLLPLKEMKFVSVSKFQQDLFYKNYQVRSKLIPWGIDTNLMPPPEKKTIDIIGIGSLIPLKDHAEFINTISQLKNDFPGINAVIIGDGKLRSKLEKQINHLELEKNIKLVGSLSYAETQEHLAKSKILLHPSEYESFGMVFAEALANNTYIVSRRVGIAKNSAHWFICNTEKDFNKGCRKFLNSSSPNITEYPRIETTVRDYFDLFIQN